MQRLLLYGSVILSMIFWSVSFIWTRIAIESFSPVTLIVLRLLIATVLLFSILLISRKLQKIRNEDLKWFLLLAFFEPYLYYMGETYGLTRVDAVLSSVIVSTIPLFAPIIAVIFLREKIGWLNIAGIIVSLAGVLLVIYEPTNGFSADLLGVCLLMLAVLSAIIYATILRKIPAHYSAMQIIFYQSLIGLIYFIPTYFVTDFGSVGHMVVTQRAVVSLIMLAVFASVIAFVFFANVVRKIGMVRTNVFVNLIPVFTAIFSWFVFDSIINLQKMVGIVIVVCGLFISQGSLHKVINRKFQKKITIS